MPLNMPIPVPQVPAQSQSQSQSQSRVMPLNEEVLTKIIHAVNSGFTASRQFSYLATIHYLTGAAWDSDIQGLLISGSLLKGVEVEEAERPRKADDPPPPPLMWCLLEHGGRKLKERAEMLKRVQHHLQPQQMQAR